MSKKYNLLELFKGTGSIGKVAHKIFNVVSLDNDEEAKPDILTDVLKWDFKKFYNETGFIPDFIWASPPCNTYSPLAYPLKERDPKTAEPYSKRAILGTKILHQTIKIINFFRKLNPDLIFVIENPKGMMRNDKLVKNLILNTTLYVLYGDKRRKHTDFFSNIDLELKPIDTPYKTKTIGVVDCKLNDRYRIPPKLITQILKRFFEEY